MARRSARAAPATSSAVSPLARRPISSAAVCDRRRLAPHDHVERRARPPRPTARAVGELRGGRSGAERPGSRAVAVGASSGCVGSVEKCIAKRRAFVNRDKHLRSLPGGPPRLDSGPMSRTFLATLHFDGTGFVGWQRQPAGRSVQVEFERVLERLFGRRTVAHAAGRTDAGVHAAGPRRQLRRSRPAGPPLAFTARSTPCSPATAGSSRCIAMQPGFHARKSALSRRYRYDIGTRRRRRPRRSAGRSSGRSAGRSTSPRSSAAATLLHGRARLPRLRRQGRAEAALPLPPRARRVDASGPTAAA